MVYLSVTTKYNLACTCCYIGDDRRKPDHVMKKEDAITIINKVR